MWKRGEIAPYEQFLPLSTIFYHLLQDYHVKTGTKFLFRDKRSFEISDVEVTRVNCNEIVSKLILSLICTEGVIFRWVICRL